MLRVCYIPCFIYLCHFSYGTCQFQYMSHDNSSCVVCLNLYMLHHYAFMLHVVFFPGSSVILNIFSSILLILIWWFGFLGSWIGFVWFKVWACVVGAFWVSLGLGSLYKHKRITLRSILREVIITCISLWSCYPKDMKLQGVTILNSVSFANHLSIFCTMLRGTLCCSHRA